MGPAFGVGFGMGVNGGGGGAPFHGQLKRRPECPPPLSQLRKDNAKKTRTHFAGHDLGTPRASAPAAPDNRHGYLLSAQGSVPPAPNPTQGLLHAVTPSAVPDSEGTGGFWRNSYGTADKEAVQAAADAGLDFLGSFYDEGGSGLDIGDDDSLERSGSDPEANAELPAKANEQPPEAFDDEGSFPPAAKRKIASQQAYIAQLEEQALTLKERIFLLEQQLKERDAQDLQPPPSPSASGHSGDTDGAASPTSSSS
ncbi:hypothetical protein HYH03_017617 [Edaphochlamys debaryana]|uniref:Uncharacterized protein n=1 Tax=Edaphochlamys debaryana TaxID=47281 RepID=A0A836BP41_9CHLO|nr:hypothetical protein HYH03_017617 [Edaphochlamys debaryana]|eukprot:KAG2483507.1 hypothetical protein HYH03_017617 [Edaphochlamys debaryana]